MPVVPIASRGLVRPFEVTIELTRRCTLECLHCITESGPDVATELPYERVLLHFEELKRLGVVMVLLDGGDPTCHSRFADVLVEAVSRFVVSLYTPLSSLDERGLDHLAAVAPNHVFAKFPGPTALKHVARTRAPGAFERACGAVRRLVEKGQNVSVVTVGTRWTLAELDEYVRLCVELGVPKLNYVRLYPLGRARTFPGGLEPDQEQRSVFARRAAGVTEVDVVHPYFPRLHNCCRVFATVLADESVIPCTYLREHVAPFGSLREHTFAELWSSDAYRAHRNIAPADPCRRCRLWDICQGGCRAGAVIATGRLDEADPECPIVRGEIIPGALEE